jgi:hypothetical protein
MILSLRRHGQGVAFSVYPLNFLACIRRGMVTCEKFHWDCILMLCIEYSFSDTLCVAMNNLRHDSIVVNFERSEPICCQCFSFLVLQDMMQCWFPSGFHATLYCGYADC